jgi:hypothetical protein
MLRRHRGVKEIAAKQQQYDKLKHPSHILASPSRKSRDRLLAANPINFFLDEKVYKKSRLASSPCIKLTTATIA